MYTIIYIVFIMDYITIQSRHHTISKQSVTNVMIFFCLMETLFI